MNSLQAQYQLIEQIYAVDGWGKNRVKGDVAKMMRGEPNTLERRAPNLKAAIEQAMLVGVRNIEGALQHGGLL